MPDKQLCLERGAFLRYHIYIVHGRRFPRRSKRKPYPYIKKQVLKGGEPVSFEAIASITKAEADAKAAVAQADVKARQMRADAENAGRAAIEAAGEKAGHEIAELRRQADEKAMDAASGLSRELEATKAALRAKAEAKLQQAATLVVERIVNS